VDEFTASRWPGISKNRLALLPSGRDFAAAGNLILLRRQGEENKGRDSFGGGGMRDRVSGVFQNSVGPWVGLIKVHQAGPLVQELKRTQRYGSTTIDEVRYLPFDPDVANLSFRLVSNRYKPASVTLASNLPFGRWADASRNRTVATTIIYQLSQQRNRTPGPGMITAQKNGAWKPWQVT